MTREDPEVTVIRYWFVKPEGSLDATRWDQYRAYFDELDLEGGVSKGSRAGAVYFFRDTFGFVGTGWYVGIANLKQAPKELVESIDSERSKRPGHTKLYQRITGDWYAFFWR